MMSTTVDRNTFYSALLLALRELRDSFAAEGSGFHRAFLAVVEKVRRDETLRLEGAHRMTLDPVFGVVNEANEMVLEAEHDRILSLMNPRLRTARFKLSAQQARTELEGLGVDADYFRTLARLFSEQMASENEQRASSLS